MTGYDYSWNTWSFTDNYPWTSKWCQEVWNPQQDSFKMVRSQSIRRCSYIRKKLQLLFRLCECRYVFLEKSTLDTEISSRFSGDFGFLAHLSSTSLPRIIISTRLY